MKAVKIRITEKHTNTNTIHTKRTKMKTNHKRTKHNKIKELKNEEQRLKLAFEIRKGVRKPQTPNPKNTKTQKIWKRYGYKGRGASTKHQVQDDQQVEVNPGATKR